MPPRPVASATVAPKAYRDCWISIRHDWWAVEVCGVLTTYGYYATGYMTVRCQKAGPVYIPCKEIHIKEVEMFIDRRKLSHWIAGTYQTGELTSGNVTHGCTSGTVVFLKAWELYVVGPNGAKSSTKDVQAPSHTC